MLLSVPQYSLVEICIGIGICPTLSIAGFFCCIPMSVPQDHLVAFCTDIGISPTRRATMLSVMLASAFVARQAWGALADRVGGLRTILAGSAFQAAAIIAFSQTQD